MSTKRELNKKNNIKVATSNNFITSVGLEKLSIKARKLLYLTVAQCKMSDDKFYYYEISVSDFAELMGIDPSNVYREADKITDELMKASIKVIPEGKKSFKKYNLMSMCEYSDTSFLKVELNPRMTDFFLRLKGSFSQPLLSDFMKMKGSYSLAVWHLMQREMKSKKPSTRRISFYLSLEELRSVTGTAEQKTYDILSNFKNRILDKAIKDIKECCATEVTYSNVKEGKTVVGFDFIAISDFGIDLTDYEPPLEVLERLNKWREREKRKNDQEQHYEPITGQLTTSDIGI